MKCTAETITPVHIGNDKEYGPSEYYKSKSSKGNQILVKTDINKVYSSLTEDQKDEFLQHLTDPTFKLEDYLNNVLGKKPPAIKQYIVLLMAKNPQTIREHIKTVEKPYIPGSSIKGAIKTAILHNIITKGDLNKIKDMLYYKNGSYSINFWKSQNFSNEFFSNPRYKDPKYSVMKFLQITDTQTTAFPTVYPIVTLKVGHAKNEWYKRNGKTVITYAETIGVKKKLDFEISSSHNPKVHRDLNVDDKAEYIEIGRIKEFMYNFSRDYIDNEISFAQKYRLDFLENFYLDLEQKNELNSPLMRIGHGSGFLGITMGLRLKEEAPETYEIVRKTFRRSYPFEFPKTRRLTVQKRPLGWVKVSTNG